MSPTNEEVRLARLMLPILEEERNAITQAIEGIRRMDAIHASGAIAATVVAGIIAKQEVGVSP